MAAGSSPSSSGAVPAVNALSTPRARPSNSRPCNPRDDLLQFRRPVLPISPQPSTPTLPLIRQRHLRVDELLSPCSSPTPTVAFHRTLRMPLMLSSDRGYTRLPPRVSQRFEPYELPAPPHTASATSAHVPRQISEETTDKPALTAVGAPARSVGVHISPEPQPDRR